MKKLLLTTTTIGALMLGAQSAQSAGNNGVYIGVFGGGVFPQREGINADTETDILRFKPGYTFGAVAGKEIMRLVRGEVEVSYARIKGKSSTHGGNGAVDPLPGDVQAVYLLANLWKDFNTGSMINPYLGGGIGLGFTNINLGTEDPVDGNDVSMAAQLGAGVRIAVSDNLAVDIGYRFKSLLDVLTPGAITGNDNAKGSYFTHTVQAGLSYSFGGPIINPGDGSDPFGRDWYISAFAGVALPRLAPINVDGEIEATRFKTGFSGGVAVGTSITPGLRGEVEFSVINTKPKNASEDAGDSPDSVNGNLTQYLLMANLWKDINLGMLTPYIGAGLGFGIVDGRFNQINSELIDDTTLALAGQFGVGVRLDVSDNITVDAGYRYKGTITAFLRGVGANNDHSTGSYLTHVVQIGATYYMGGRPNISPVAGAGSPASDLYVTAFGGAAFAPEASIQGGNDQMDLRFDTGFIVGAAVGTNITSGVRGELEVSYLRVNPKDSRNNGPDDNRLPVTGNNSQVYILANLWKDFDLGVGVMPYIGGGLGMGILKTRMDDNSDIEVKDTQVGFAGQVGIGVRMALTDNITADVGYRYKVILDALARGRTGSDDNTAGTYENHIVQAGLSWAF